MARATVVVERGPSELLNHMVPHFQDGLGAGEVDKPSMMIECDLVGVFFCQYFFCFPLQDYWQDSSYDYYYFDDFVFILLLYIYQCRIYVYTRCLQIKVLVLVGSIFAPVDMANIQSKTATTCF